VDRAEENDASRMGNDRLITGRQDQFARAR